MNQHATIFAAATEKSGDTAPPAALVRRSFDAAEINPILNDPRVFESIKLPGMKPGDLDITPVIQNPANVLLMADGGGIIFAQQPSGMYDTRTGEQQPSGIYDVHTSFLKPARNQKGQGPHIRNVCLAAYRWMFMHTDCMVLQTKVPAFNRAAIVFAPLLGWRFEFERKAVWPTDEGHADMSFFSLRYEDWARRDDQLVRSGRAFHQRLDEEFARHKALHDNHPDDECHDRYVGACAEMILAGQPEKAVVLYNRFARFSGYGAITLVSRSPLLLDIGTAVLIVDSDNFRVITCRPQP